MAAYPSTIPLPALEGYALTPVDGVARSDISAGRRVARQRVAAPNAVVPVRWVFRQVELAVFEAWHRHTALDGAAWFSISLRNGQGASTVTARFDGPWEAVATGLNFIVTAALRVRALPVAA